MPRKPLRPQLNQIRAWVRQGRTDAWIAHQLEIPTSELREFVRRHDLSADDEGTGEIDLRDEIEAEIEATLSEEEDAEDDDEEDEAGDDDEDADADETSADDRDDSDDAAPRRRRRRRGGRGRGRGARSGADGLQATFDHGENDGYGLWLDPAVADDPVYSEHWSGKRRVDVTIEADRIVIKRSGEDS